MSSHSNHDAEEDQRNRNIKIHANDKIVPRDEARIDGKAIGIHDGIGPVMAQIQKLYLDLIAQNTSCV
ncbi:MAG: hypothetical protein K9G33_09985 [Sneathiella sp.]|nr:hypothetical protein [Sneathiella sp.]